MTTRRTPTRNVETATAAPAAIAPATRIARDPGARILKKLHASRPALSGRDPGATRS